MQDKKWEGSGGAGLRNQRLCGQMDKALVCKTKNGKGRVLKHLFIFEHVLTTLLSVWFMIHKTS